jgi:NADH-quinone oxidoreductase subunit M
MILLWMIAIPLAGGVLAWLAGRRRTGWARLVSLAAAAANLALALWLLAAHHGAAPVGHPGPWLVEWRRDWIPSLGISFHLAVDGLGLLMVVLAAFIGVAAVLVSWRQRGERVALFHACQQWVLAGVIGVFTALDLFLFYFFWEVMLVPMVFLIGLFGHERRIYAAVKFFIFTLAGGLLMLVAILALYFVHGRETGTYTFEYTALLGTPLEPTTGLVIMLGFFVAFAVKLPVVPLHTWLPDAHTEAPTAGSLLLAALLLKTGAYGLIRFAVPLFPEAALSFQPVALSLGVAGILYGGVLAFGQTDLKRMVAYTSVSHMGFVLVGVYAWNGTALEGAVMQMICHAVSTGALFIIAGFIQDRTHTRDMSRLGGLWASAPRMGGAAVVFAMASLGLPGLGNFVGEIMVLFGAYRVSPMAAATALVGVVVAAVYSLFFFQRVFHGTDDNGWKIADLSRREMAIMAVLIAVIVWLGLWPRPVLDTAAPAVETAMRWAAGSAGGAP